jgi:hypothetical protein
MVWAYDFVELARRTGCHPDGRSINGNIVSVDLGRRWAALFARRPLDDGIRLPRWARPRKARW